MKSADMPNFCHVTPTVSNEQFIPEHIFVYLEAGSMTIYDGNKEYALQSGDYGFAKRNHLARYIKLPPPGGKFTTMSFYFDQDFLRSFSNEYAYTMDGPVSNKDAIEKLDPNPLFENFLQSLSPYEDFTGAEHNNFLTLKKKEIILILLKINPGLKNALFDFSDPGKIDLEAFMNRNYKFNVSMERFSYLTGRSLTTFKRDFEKIFNNSPGRWLLEKRLSEAHYLIEKKGQKPSEVYLEVGFEDLSHFSFAFKKMYGIAPSGLSKHNV